MFTDVEFAQPLWLFAMPISVVALGWWLLRRAARPDDLIALLPSAEQGSYVHTQIARLRALFQDAQASRCAPRKLFFAIVLGLAAVMFHLALAHPYRLGERLPDPPAYRDVVFVVDVSVTTLLRDYVVEGERVDRLTMLKSVLNHFVDQLDGNRIGLVVFAEQAYTLVPLTADYRVVQTQLRRLQSALIGRMSDVGKALVYTVQMLGSQSPSTPDDRPVLVLISDVNRPVRVIDPRAAAAYAAREGYTLHTIAVGAGSAEGEQKDAHTLIYEPASFELLQEIATHGGGQFTWAQDTDSLRNAIHAIQTGAVRKVAQPPRYVPISLYQWPLGAGLFMLVLVQLVVLSSGARDNAAA